MSRDWSTGIVLTLASLVLVVLSVLLASARAQDCVDPLDLDANVTAPCKGTLMPEADMRFYFGVEDALKLCKSDLAFSRVELQACRDLSGVDDSECRTLLQIKSDALTACETQRACPPPPPLPEEPEVYERWTTWVGVGVTTVAIVVGVTSGDHPLVWAAGGFGVGIVIGGAL